jgi:tetratricopeptide (TPR) repeat protein
VIALGCVVLAAVTAAAQVQPSQSGTLLDSNFQVGSGGYNRVQGGVGGVNSQLYVTGQVSGLAGFGGSVPYYAANQLNMPLPSDSMTLFNRQSVGVQQVLGGNPYATTPYFSSNQTVLGYRALVEGVNVPGSNVPAQPTGPMQMYDRYPYGPSISPTGGTLGQAPLSIGQGGLYALPPMSGNPALAAPLAAGQEGQLQSPNVFANLTDRQRLNLARQLMELRRREQAAQEQEQAPPQRVRAQVQAQVQAQAGPQPQQLVPGQIQPRTPTPGPAGAQEPPPDQAQQVQQAPQAQQPQQGQQAPQAQQAGQAQPALVQQQPEDTAQTEETLQGLPAGQDAFYDLLRRLRRQEIQDQQPSLQPGRQAPGEPSGRPGQPSGAPPMQRSGRVTPPQPLPGQEQQPGREPPPSLIEPLPAQGLVLHSLAGQSPDLVNYYLKRAQAKFHEGKYYEAAGDYGICATVDPANPLPRVGEGLALFAAGEPLSAALRVRKAMELFPPLMQTRLDLANMVGDMELMDVRLETLAERLSRSTADTQPMLLFIGAFVNENLGRHGQALEYARQLEQLGEPGVYQEYARTVIQAPASQPAQSQPATGGAPR